MPAYVFAAVLAAAAMHAGWNAFLKLRIEPFLAIVLVNAGCAVVALPALLWFGFPAVPAWPWLLTSVALHLGYYFGLSAAYARADMSQVYPIARGGAPLMTATVATFVLREPVAPLQLAGIVLLACGVLSLAVVGRRRGTPFDPVAIAVALGTAAIICGYTLVDGLGARAAGDPSAYSAALFVIDGIPLALFAAWSRGRTGLAPMWPYWRYGLVAGAMSFGSYWIAIWAMTVAPIALVAALRESSVLFAAVIAVLILKEPLQWGRALASAVILASLALIRLG